MSLSLNDLKYFIETAQTKNISRASERLGISQPSLSLAIQRIEYVLGERIMNRTRKGVELTRPGEVLFQHSLSLLESWEDLVKQAQMSVTEPQGQLRIGCHPSVALYGLAVPLPRLLKKYPKLKIKLTHDLSRKVNEMIVSHKIDLGLVVNPLPQAQLIIREICTDEVCLWKQKHLKEHEELPIICDPNLSQSQFILSKLAKRQKLNLIETSSLELIAAMTQQGGGIGILPTRVANLQGDLQKVLHSPVYKDRICLVYRAEDRKLRSLRVTIEEIEKFFEQN